ncbi:hypothetical protein D3C72_829060 [compost metagenome]
MRLLEHFHALGRRHQRNEGDGLVLHAAPLEHIHGMRSRIARGDHRVAQDEAAVLHVGQPHQVFHRAVLLVAVHADMADARRRDQLDQAIAHAHAGAQHRHDGQLLAGDHRRIQLHQRRVDAARGQRQVARDLVAHQQRDLAQQLAEGARGRFLVAHVRELVLDQRVIEDEEIGETRILFHGGGRLGGGWWARWPGKAGAAPDAAGL